MPGDRVRAVVGKSKRAYAEARAVEILEPSPDRIAPVADHPGAPWQVLPYERQLEVKAEQVDDALRRIGRLDGFELEPIVPAVEQWRYRNKLEYSFGTGAGRRARVRLPRARPLGRDRPDGRLPARLRARQRGCASRCSPGRASRASAPGTGATSAGFLRNLVVREGRRTGELQVRLVTSPGELDVDALVDAVDCDGPVLDADRRPRREHPGRRDEAARRAPRSCASELGDLDFLISPEAFFQTNTEMAEQLYGVGGRVRRRCAATSASSTSTAASARSALSLASRAREVVGVEIVEPAVADAIENARLNEITNARFFAGDIRLAMRELVEQAGQARRRRHRPAARRPLAEGRAPDRRGGAEADRLRLLQPDDAGAERRAARRGRLRARQRVRPVDMFPQTPHIECVALLEAGPDGVANPDR